MKYNVILVYDGGMDWIEKYDMPLKLSYDIIGRIEGVEFGWAHIELGIFDATPGMYDHLTEVITEIKKTVFGKKSRYELRLMPIDGDGRYGALLEPLYVKAGINSILFIVDK